VKFGYQQHWLWNITGPNKAKQKALLAAWDFQAMGEFGLRGTSRAFLLFLASLAL